MIFANDHWNFNVRNFNPGGNHGSFLRASTHAILLFAGGADTGIPHHQEVQEPYDSLSFVPTILDLMGMHADAAKLPGHADSGSAARAVGQRYALTARQHRQHIFHNALLVAAEAPPEFPASPFAPRDSGLDNAAMERNSSRMACCRSGACSENRLIALRTALLLVRRKLMQAIV